MEMLKTHAFYTKEEILSNLAKNDSIRWFCDGNFGVTDDLVICLFNPKVQEPSTIFDFQDRILWKPKPFRVPVEEIYNDPAKYWFPLEVRKDHLTSAYHLFIHYQKESDHTATLAKRMVVVMVEHMVTNTMGFMDKILMLVLALL